ncbi:uncharacterized protein LOC105640670 isoform X1 [Jatropha curcas]|uniref:uncharacterized protein LOC105640670 isoform X1 n=1 Tax=Jatropha curcas TaxID=180498 RepID=UPI001894721A|nr:uncharacterized protein LOC105640670 isoform X1 [Jatropha curcas]XP_012080435.2 uncharacterized protein LOC105640670 isoform X1 [Jatropha curcas]XP_020537440.2 uncharacterized protein LOC105640670 isoform X1 [Jatropha curcas]XP_037491794.1 uncharacterized protein LOC105640670 isoform X1 [Jatropha curcas]
MGYCKFNRNKRTNCTAMPSRMFQFIRELNMIYAIEKPANNESLSSYVHTDMPIYKAFQFIGDSQDLKVVIDIQKKDFEHKKRKKEEIVDRKVSTKKEQESKFMAWENPVNCEGSVNSTTSESEGKEKIYFRKEMEEKDNNYHNIPEMVAFIQESNSDSLLKDIIMDDDSVDQAECSLNENYGLEQYNLSSSILNYDTESNDSIKETLERLQSIANELDFVTCDFKNEVEVEEEEEEEEDFDERDDVWIDHTDNKIEQLIENQDFKRRDEGLVQYSAEKLVEAIQLIKELQDDCNIHQCGSKKSTEKEPADIKERNDIHQTKEEEALPNSLLSCSNEAADNNCPTNDACESEEETIISSLNSSNSAHSFAFPVLASEGAESPMWIGIVNNGKQWQATANRRHWHRPRRWRSLVCCKGNFCMKWS